MMVLRRTYNKVKRERDEALAKLEALEKSYMKDQKNFERENNFFVNSKNDIKQMVDDARTLYDKLGNFLALISDKKMVEAEVKSNRSWKEVKTEHLEALKKLEAKLKEIPAGAQGTGGIEVIKNGKREMLNFKSKSELEKIYKDAKKGKITLAVQAW